MKKFLTSAASASLLLVAAPASANDLGFGFSWSANVAVTSDYIFRGFSETGGRPALQGGFDVEHESGFYIGNWNSSVNFGDEDPAYVEMDIYGGFAFDPMPGLTVDIGALRYYFPNARSDEFNEYYIGVASEYNDLSGDLYVFYSDDYLSSDESSVIVELNLAYALPRDTYVMGQLGYADSDAFEPEDDSYVYYGLGAGVEFAGLDFSMMWADQDLDSRSRWAFMVATEF